MYVLYGGWVRLIVVPHSLLPPPSNRPPLPTSCLSPRLSYLAIIRPPALPPCMMSHPVVPTRTLPSSLSPHRDPGLELYMLFVCVCAHRILTPMTHMPHSLSPFLSLVPPCPLHYGWTIVFYAYASMAYSPSFLPSFGFSYASVNYATDSGVVALCFVYTRSNERCSFVVLSQC